MSDSADNPAAQVREDSAEDDLNALVAGFEAFPAGRSASVRETGATAEEAGVPVTAVTHPPGLVSGVGAWFQPVAGGVLPVPTEREGALAALITGARTTLVHAPSALTVESVEGEAVATRTYDGLLIRLTATDSDRVAWCVVAGDQVAPGGLLGNWAPDSSPARALVVSVRDGQGRPVDAVELLTGLPDPGELGLVAGPEAPVSDVAVPLRAGPATVGSLDRADGFDPFDLDLELGMTVVPSA